MPERGARPRTHRVAEGDSLWSISARYRVSLPALRAANRLEPDSDFLAAGADVLVPDYASRHVSAREGDTLEALARAFATTAGTLRECNPGAGLPHDARAPLGPQRAALYLPRRDLGAALRPLRADSPLSPAREHDRASFWGVFAHTRDVEYYRGACPRTRPLLDALRMVETSNIMPAPKGDGGASIGPLQISQEYHADAWERARQTGGAPPQYDAVEGIAAAEETALRYWLRYCPWALQFGDLEHLARTHNGGPGWNRAFKTGRYWRKAAIALDGARKRGSGGGEGRRRSAVVREPFPAHHARLASDAAGAGAVSEGGDAGVGALALVSGGASGLAQIPFAALNPDWVLRFGDAAS